MHFLIYRMPVLVYMVLIFYMSSGPVDTRIAGELPDWLLHGAAYLVLYLLAFWAVHEGMRPRPGRGGFVLPLLVTVLYGVSDEIHQGFVPARDASARDAIADAAGALLGVGLVRLYGRRKAATAV
ncbi:MAG: VanZ family protein [Acidobacteria bacterium]|nr:VanZ family protein [Acidobacteriota bacterium]